VPTLIKKLPSPLRRIVGDLSNAQRVLVGLDLKPKTHAAKKKRLSKR
jgi:circadian clock protein KaiB